MVDDYANMWVISHKNNRANIDNISNSEKIKGMTKKELYFMDFDLLLSAIEVIWDNRPSDLTDKEEQNLIVKLGRKYQEILKI